jgi:catechol 2,3-dioxygenase-like lactoylglutathione lyase family enzyme
MQRSALITSVSCVTAVELAPILNVSDWIASAEWFQKLGFQPGFVWSPEPGAPPTFGSVVWGDIQIFVCVDAQGGRGNDGVWLSIFVDDVDAVHARCVREGLEITRPPVDEVWGVREFHLRHPDGHVFRIGTGSEDE